MIFYLWEFLFLFHCLFLFICIEFPVFTILFCLKKINKSADFHPFFCKNTKLTIFFVLSNQIFTIKFLKQLKQFNINVIFCLLFYKTF
jgi:hypothetical protein